MLENPIIQALKDLDRARTLEADIETAIHGLAADLVVFERLDEFPPPEWFARAIALPLGEDEALDRIEVAAQALRTGRTTMS